MKQPQKDRYLLEKEIAKYLHKNPDALSGDIAKKFALEPWKVYKIRSKLRAAKLAKPYVPQYQVVSKIILETVPGGSYENVKTVKQLHELLVTMPYTRHIKKKLVWGTLASMRISGLVPENHLLERGKKRFQRFDTIDYVRVYVFLLNQIANGLDVCTQKEFDVVKLAAQGDHIDVISKKLKMKTALVSAYLKDMEERTKKGYTHFRRKGPKVTRL